jgi:hypothetical protein
MTNEDREAMASQVSAMQKAVQEAMGGMELTPEQRARLPGMLGAPQPGTRPKPTISRIGDTAVVNGSKCEAWKVQAGRKTVIGWATRDHRDLAETYRSMVAKQVELSPEGGFSDEAEALIAEKGMVMRVQELEMSGYGRPEYRISDVLEVTEATVSDAAVTVPRDFPVNTPQDMMAEQMGGNQMPPGAIPPGMQLPPGVQLPPGMQAP